MSEDTEAEEVSQEDAEVEIVEQAELQEDKIQDTVEESLDSEPVVEIPQEEIEEICKLRRSLREREL